MEFIFGIAAGLLIQALKKVLGTNTFGTYVVVLGVSLAGAAVYVLFKDTAIWPVVIQIATVAGAFYAFVIRRFEEE